MKVILDHDVVNDYLRQLLAYRCLETMIENNSSTIKNDETEYYWNEAISHPDIKYITSRISEDPVFGRLVQWPTETRVFGQACLDKHNISSGATKKESLDLNYQDMMKTIDQTIRWRNPSNSKQSIEDKLIHGGFYPAPELA